MRRRHSTDKMGRRFGATVAVLLLGALATGCSGGGDSSGDSAMDTAAGGAGESLESPRAAMKQSGANRAPVQTRAVIKTGQVAVTSEDLDPTRQEVDDLLRALGGNLDQERTSHDDEGRIEGAATIGLDVTAQVVARNLLAGQARQSAFIAGIGTALTSGEPLAVQLDRCCRGMVGLGAAFARIWLHNEEDSVLELHASAGIYTNLDGAHSRVQVGQFKIGRIAAERKPHLTNSVVHDPLVADRAWASREGLIAFAGYPLILGERLVGVMALFAREELSESTLGALGAVADQIALAVERDRVERFRELFIGMLGHDLRNPLNAVLTGAQLLGRHPEVPPGPREIASRIRRSASRMNRMIEQLLDYTRVSSAAGIPIMPDATDMFAICRDTLDELQAAHPDRVIALSVSGSGAGQWDADRMSQVFSNLIGNALAYGDPAEAIHIALDGDGDRLVCQVHNVGPSIPVGALPHIFHPFRERGEGNHRGSGGLGLGLFITREILKAHGGEITVHSSDLSGTTFRWTIPKTAPSRSSS